MALLRVSSHAIGDEADLTGAVGEGDGGVPQGAELIRFAECATQGNEDLSEARKALQAAVGLEAFVLAACTVGIFNGLVRTADSIGIPVDRGMVGRTADFRQDLGLNHFSGSRNTELSNEATDTGPTAIPDLFGN